MYVCVYMRKGHSFHNVISHPPSVDDLPVVSDKERARGEHGVKNGVEIHQLN